MRKPSAKTQKKLLPMVAYPFHDDDGVQWVWN
jgi:hypothetical protein